MSKGGKVSKAADGLDLHRGFKDSKVLRVLRVLQSEFKAPTTILQAPHLSIAYY